MLRRSRWAARSCRRREPRRLARWLTTSRTPTRRIISRRTLLSVSCRHWSARRSTSWRASWPSPNAPWPICRRGCMNAHLKAFLQFLRLNRNASAHTVRAYQSDLSQFLDHTAALADVKRAALEASHLDRTALRGFLADLHKRGLSRASAARKLAAARTFLRYLRREGMVDDDAGAMVPTPKRDVRMPVHLSEQEMARLV